MARGKSRFPGASAGNLYCRALEEAKNTLAGQRLAQQRREDNEAFQAQVSKYFGLMENADFGDYSGCTVEDIMAAEQQAEQNALRLKEGVAGDPSMNQAHLEAEDAHNGLLRLAGVADYLTAEERNIWNYLRQTQGPEAAQEYVDCMQEVWNQRKGEATAEKLGNLNPLLRFLGTGAYGVAAYLDNIGSGVNQFFSEERLPKTDLQYGSARVRDDLESVGPKLFGSSLGQLAYDVAPGLGVNALVGATFGPVGNAVLTGLQEGSSVGNNYRDALEKGYTKEDAYLYGVASGVQSVVMSKAFGALKGNVANKLQIEDAVLNALYDTGAAVINQAAGKALQDDLQKELQSWLTGYQGEIEALTPMDVYEFTVRFLQEKYPDMIQQIPDMQPLMPQYYVGWDED